MWRGKKLYIGIDFGNSTTQLAYFDPKKEESILIPQNKKENILSTVEITANKKGELAYQIGNEFDKTANTKYVFDMKRIMGKTIDEIQELPQNYPFEIIDDDEEVKIRIHEDKIDVTYSPEEIASYILKVYSKILEKDYQGAIISKAIVSIPVESSQEMKDAIESACHQAGFTEIEMIYESTASVLAYTKQFELEENTKVAVVNVGGSQMSV